MENEEILLFSIFHFPFSINFALSNYAFSRKMSLLYQIQFK